MRGGFTQASNTRHTPPLNEDCQDSRCANSGGFSPGKEIQNHNTPIGCKYITERATIFRVVHVFFYGNRANQWAPVTKSNCQASGQASDCATVRLCGKGNCRTRYTS